MEEILYKAAMSEANAASLSEIHEEDRVNLVMSYLNASPLHLAAFRGNLEFVKRVVHQIPQLAEAIDSRTQTPLHLASAEGHIDIVKELVSAKVNMCTSRDLDGRNPLHVALVNGKVDVLEVLLQACPLAAQARVDRDETVFHLCVKHNQVQALELLFKNPKLEELVNAKDADGNTVLHLAVVDANFEIVNVLCVENIDMKVKNMNGHTALDMLSKRGSNKTSVQHSDRQFREEEKKRIEKFMRERGGIKARQIKEDDWLAKKKDSIMVVAALIATEAFQGALTPPGGTWQDNSDGHVAGKTIMAYTSPESYKYFVLSNAIAFGGSLITILLIANDYGKRRLSNLLFQVITLTISVISMAFTYVGSVTLITPENIGSWLKTIGIVIMLTTLSMAVHGLSIALVGIVGGKIDRCKARRTLNRSESTLPELCEIHLMGSGPMNQELK